MARVFTAASSHYLEYAGAVSTSVPLTLACWCNRATSVSSLALSIADTTNANTRFAIRASGASNLFANHHDGTTNGQATHGSTITNGVWQHWCGVFTANNSRTIYLDGGGAVTNTTNVTGSMAGCNRTTVGRRSNSTPADYFNGSLAEAAVWGAALDADEVAALADGVSPFLIRPTSLLAYWPIAGRYSPEIDVRGGFDLTVTGATVADHPRVYLPSSPVTYFVPSAGGAFTLGADVGAYAVAGQATTLNAARLIVPGGGSYSVGGQAAGLYHGYPLAAGAGSYAVTGQTATLTAARVLACAGGSVAVAGGAAGLLAARALAAGVGACAVAGQTTGLLAGRALGSAAGAFTVAGSDATLTYTPVGGNRTIACDAGAFTVAGDDVALTVAGAAQPTTASSGGGGGGGFVRPRRRPARAAEPEPDRPRTAWRLWAWPGRVSVRGRPARLVVARRLAAAPAGCRIVGTPAELRPSLSAVHRAIERRLRIQAEDDLLLSAGPR